MVASALNRIDIVSIWHDFTAKLDKNKFTKYDIFEQNVWLPPCMKSCEHCSHNVDLYKINTMLMNHDVCLDYSTLPIQFAIFYEVPHLSATICVLYNTFHCH